MAALDTKEQINTFRVRVAIRAIDLYLKSGMQVNRAYTPQNMRNMATSFTGEKYARSRNGLMAARHDLQQLLQPVV